MATITIDGKDLEVAEGTLIIEAAEHLGIEIPHFCFHNKLSIAANCRMCLVEVEKSGKPLPACATPVTDGMKVHTTSKKTKESQRAVMEFLLINHPLDCPICDQAGECDLQDISLEYGSDTSRFSEGKRSVVEQSIGPLIATEMTRCIHCTRCVRFGAEIAGLRELGTLNRGNNMEIRTAIQHTVQSELSGNIIDLCPVGALTSKPYRFQARAFELEQKPSIAPHDCLGSNIFLHVRGNGVMRVVPKENEAINEIWISDKDRFSYLGLSSPDRITTPLVKKAGIWQEVSWEEALQLAAFFLKKAAQQPETLGALTAPTATVEELYLLQKLVRGLGSNNIDHRLRQLDFKQQENMSLYPTLGIPIAAIEQQDVVMLVGSQIHKEQPLLGARLRKMQNKGGKIAVINPVDWQFTFEVTAKNIVPGGDFISGLLQIVKALVILSQKKNLTAEKWLSNKQIEPDNNIANLLLTAENAVIFLGHFAITHPQFSHILAIVECISEFTNVKIGILTEGSNSSGAWLSGCVPHRAAGGKPLPIIGLNANTMWQQKLSSYLLMGVEPDLDCAHSHLVREALQKADSVIALSSYRHPLLLEQADIILPMATFSEIEGTFINIEGLWQHFLPAVTPLGDSKPAWEILTLLITRLQIINTNCATPEQTIQELKAQVTEQKNNVEKTPWYINVVLDSTQNQDEIIRLAPIPLYASDPLVRRSPALQTTQEAEFPMIRMNSKVAKHLQLVSGQNVEVMSQVGKISLSMIVDESIPNKSVVINGAHPATSALDAPYSALKFIVG